MEFRGRLTSYRGKNIRCKVDARQTCKVQYMSLMHVLESPYCHNMQNIREYTEYAELYQHHFVVYDLSVQASKG